jgi:hypothetical protein
MIALPGILFPHSQLRKSLLRRILPFFGPLTIFQPWFMERPPFLSEASDLDLIQVLNPPTNLKPEIAFKTLLAEYHRWMNDHQDRSYLVSLKAQQEGAFREETTWEIRQMLRNADQDTPASLEDQATRWHLILHLAREIQEQREEAEGLLKIIWERGSPLEGIFEEKEDLESPFEDLTPFEKEPIVEDSHLRQVFEAWFSLFGGYLRGDEFLITCDPRVMDCVCHLSNPLDGDEEGLGWATVHLAVADLSEHSLEDLVEIKRALSHKATFRELKDQVHKSGEDPTRALPLLKGLAEEMRAFCPGKTSGGNLKITYTHTPPLEDQGGLTKDALLRHLANRNLVLVEETV